MGIDISACCYVFSITQLPPVADGLLTGPSTFLLLHEMLQPQERPHSWLPARMMIYCFKGIFRFLHDLLYSAKYGFQSAIYIPSVKRKRLGLRSRQVRNGAKRSHLIFSTIILSVQITVHLAAYAARFPSYTERSSSHASW